MDDSEKYLKEIALFCSIMTHIFRAIAVVAIAAGMFILAGLVMMIFS